MKKYTKLLIILVFGSWSMQEAKEVSVSSEKKFYRRLDKHDLAVVMFYKEDREVRKDRVLKQRIKNLENMFKATSTIRRYEEANIVFIKVNTAKNAVSDLHRDFQVTKLPAFVVFKYNTPVRDEQKNIVQLNGFVSREALKEFIDKNLEDAIDDIIEEKGEIRKRKLEEERLRYRYYGPYFNYGYSPYYYHSPYYYGYPYGRPGFGFSFGI